MQAFENCPHNNGDKKGCPYYHEVFGKCFSHCDLKSELVCGDCAHWLGDCTSGDGRHEVYGHCFYSIELVNANFRTNCKHYTERKPNEPNYVDWVETRVIELGGASDSSPENRKLRIQARKEWKDSHN